MSNMKPIFKRKAVNIMVKTYRYNDSTQLSPHFNVQEFRCKCGNQHDILISEELINKLEELFTELDCSKIIISSGYRCSTHDRNVGGDGKGYHTKGMAADCCCYAKNGAVISTKIVCCKAQDLSFGGIANINSTYTYTHLDVRTGGRWLGDETKGYNTVTSDFYKYFGISNDKPTPNKPTKTLREGDKGEDVKLLQQKLKDIHYYNGDISGNFDIYTLGAVLAFQMKNDLDVDGITGNQTYAKLFK